MMKNSYTWLAVGLIAMIAAYSGYKVQQLRHSQIDSAAVAEVIGQPLPEFTLNDLDGTPVSSSVWSGQVRLINFWASWCPPCRREIPGFAEVHDFYRDQGFEVIGIAVDRHEDVTAFLQSMPSVNYPQLIGEHDAIEVGRVLGNPSGSLPYSVLVDGAGLIRFAKHGELEKIELLEMLEPLLK